MLSAAFELPRPGEGGKQVGSATGTGGTRYVVTVTRVQDGELSAMAESDITSVRSLLENRTASVDFEGFYNSLEADASIDRP